MKRLYPILLRVLTYSILIVGLLFILLPFAWMLLTSLKPSAEVLLMPPKWLPSRLQWENYRDAFAAAPFFTYLKNSVLVSVAITGVELVTTIFAAYAFAKMDFKFKNILFTLLIATMMVPSEILIIPNYVLLANLGWIDSYKALVLPWCASVFSIFLLRQRFSEIPDEYYKAARMDKCSDLKYLWYIMVPMAKPTLISIGLLKFINSWNSYMWPLIVTNTPDMRTLPVALAAFTTEAGTKYHQLMAFSVMSILPILVIYLLCQKYITEGVGSGIKG